MSAFANGAIIPDIPQCPRILSFGRHLSASAFGLVQLVLERPIRGATLPSVERRARAASGFIDG